VGYRNHISRIEKKELPKLSLLDDHEYQREVTEDLYEIGKYYEHPDEDWEELYNFDSEDTEYKIITKESLKAIIRQFAKWHLEYLQGLVKSEENLTSTEKHERERGIRDTPLTYVQKKLMEWEMAESVVYDIDDDSHNIVHSWSYEYIVFELIHIYKTFDDEKYYLVYRGS
jgi:hypothetical protein